MKCNLANMLRQAMNCIDPKKDTGAYAYVIGEVIEHIEQVRAGTVTLDQFADFYCLRPQ